MTRALETARYLLYKANSDGSLITNLKMQKLLYYAQAWHLVNFSRPLFPDPVMAWKFGPIVEDVYHHFKHFRYSPIKDNKAEDVVSKIPAETKKYLDVFYGVFISYSASDLTQMSHNEAPWRETPQDKEITIRKIEDFYKEQYNSQLKKKERARV